MGGLVARSALVPIVSLVLAGANAGAQTANASDAGRAVHEKWQRAVVTARLVMKTRVVMGGREMQSMEEALELPATIVDGTGLAVVALSSLNPGETMKRMMPQMGGQTPRVDFETTPADVKLRLADGQELAAKVVLRDTDLDLAFIRPAVKPATALVSVDLANPASPRLLDEVVMLSRLGSVGNWQATVMLERIQAVLDKPRRLYVAGASHAGNFGTPVFALDGRLVGFLLMRVSPDKKPGMFTFFGGPAGMGMLPIILPAADVLTVAKQATQ